MISKGTNCLSGQALLKAIKDSTEESEALIEGLVYANSAIMIFADDGLGKSIISLQTALQSSKGDKVFGGLNVPKPLKVVYAVAERGVEESLHRLNLMTQAQQINPDNLCITDELMKGYKITTEEGMHKAVNVLQQASHQIGANQPDICYVDPIYPLIKGGLSSDETASYITDFCRAIQVRLQCSLVIVHHTNRGGRNTSGRRTEGDMYGNRFLSAYFTGSFHLRANPVGNGVTLYRMKNSHANLVPEVKLRFDKEYFLSFLQGDTAPFTKEQLFHTFVDQCRQNKKKFAFKDVEKALSNVSHQHIRRLLKREADSGTLKVLNPNSTSRMYETQK